MAFTFSKRLALKLYDLGWRLAIPFLKWNHRLDQGFDKRTLAHGLPPACDLWIQAASAGEAHLALELLKNLDTGREVRVLVTTNTSQGLGILEKGLAALKAEGRRLTVHATYFPFDRPKIMAEIVRHVRPEVAVLLETELWPGQLLALKALGAKILFVNARMRTQSLARYLAWPSLWELLRPTKVLAISEPDRRRFKALFGDGVTRTMSNIKFDRITAAKPMPFTKNPVASLIRAKAQFLVMGSVRRQEEYQVHRMISELRKRRPKAVFGLFPRHMHRVEAWKRRLEISATPYVLRSEAHGPVPFGTVILWDKFGELPLAYWVARAAFVGGSLAPLGGQNFLEALTCGIIPVTGPSWENFAWVGEDIVEKGLLSVATDWRDAADILDRTMVRPKKPESVRKMIMEYVSERRGGSEQACELIAGYLDKGHATRARNGGENVA